MNRLKLNKLLLRMREFRKVLAYEFSQSSRQQSFAQHGEDLVIATIFEEEKGMYIDVGCSLPRKFSNTYFFYRRGWKGIAIDANVDLKYLWRVIRYRDRFINAVVSD